MHTNTDEQRTAMLAAIIESSEDAIISKDLESRVTSWNKSAERLFGYKEDEMVGQLIHTLIPDDRKHEEETIISSLKRGERVEHFETIRRTKDGRLIPISLTISPIRNTVGQVVGASKIARDISLQKQNEERLRIINEVGQSVSAELDIEEILQKVTDATTKLSGAAFGAFFFNKIDASGEAYMLHALCGAPRAAFEKFGMPRNTGVFAPTFGGMGIVRSDDITRDPRYGHNSPHHGMPEGHLPVVSYLAVPVLSQKGIVIGGLFFGHPEPAKFTLEHEWIVSAIGAQAAVALTNAKLYQEINALNKKKDDFIGFASHELKTPLTTIKSYLQLGQTVGMGVDEIYPKVIKQINRLESLVNDLLDISRIQSGNLEYHFEKISLTDLVRDSVESIDVSDHQVITDLPGEEVFLTVDRSKITQVLVNLISNAAKYSNAGTVISIHAEVLGDEVEIAVKDEGIGIPPSELTQIFNQYYRFAGSLAKAKGMGLGLFIAKQIMQAHLGQIWAESEEGVGSVFHITVPLERAKSI